jgi:hypothetical protein
MEDLIKEVLEYTHPKPVADNIPQKKPAGKGATKIEEAPVDPYAGFDTTIYKEIGH